MKKKTCAAPNCEKEFLPKVPHSKYCSDQCRSRAHKQKVYEERKKDGLCPQCGGKMIVDKSSASYCVKCQDYFSKRYHTLKVSSSNRKSDL